MSKLLHGEVIASHGRHYMVQQDDGAIRTCVPRGKRSDIACGDRVAFAATSEGEGVIEALDPRSSLFYRSVAHRAKLIGANLTQIVYVVATEPNWSDEIVCRVIAAAEQQRMRSLIVLNKSDLPGTAPARDRLAPYRRPAVTG